MSRKAPEVISHKRMLFAILLVELFISNKFPKIFVRLMFWYICTDILIRKGPRF